MEKTGSARGVGTRQDKLGNAPIGRLVVGMSLPMMFSLLIQSLYNIVDGIYVARLSEEALTATSVAFPIQMLMIASAVGTCVGLNAVLSKTLGEGKTQQASRIAFTALMLSFATSLLFVLPALFFIDPLCMALAGDAQLASLCRDYLFTCMAFSTGVFLKTMFQRFLQSTGKTLLSMLGMLSGAVINIILDPILIFGLCGAPAMGIRGAAVATVIGQWGSALIGFLLNHFFNPQVRLRFCRFDARAALAIYKVGLPTIATQALGSVMVTSVNSILMPFSSTAVAFFGVYFKLQNFLFMPMNGLGQAEIPIIAYNYGAKKGDRIKKTMRITLPIAACVALLGAAVFALFPKALLMPFSPSEAMLALGVPALRIICVTFPFAAMTVTLGYSASALGNGLVNMFSMLIRQIVLFVPLVWLFVHTGGVQSVWYAMWISESVAAIFCALAVKREFAKKVTPLCSEN